MPMGPIHKLIHIHIRCSINWWNLGIGTHETSHSSTDITNFQTTFGNPIQISKTFKKWHMPPNVVAGNSIKHIVKER